MGAGPEVKMILRKQSIAAGISIWISLCRGVSFFLQFASQRFCNSAASHEATAFITALRALEKSREKRHFLRSQRSEESLLDLSLRKAGEILRLARNDIPVGAFFPPSVQPGKNRKNTCAHIIGCVPALYLLPRSCCTSRPMPRRRNRPQLLPLKR